MALLILARQEEIMVVENLIKKFGEDVTVASMLEAVSQLERKKMITKQLIENSQWKGLASLDRLIRQLDAKLSGTEEQEMMENMESGFANSNRVIREIAESAFDEVFNKPILSKDKSVVQKSIELC